MDPHGIVVIILVLVVASLFALYRRRVDGNFRTVPDPAVDSQNPISAAAQTEANVLRDLLPEDLDSRPLFVQFSGEYCAVCKRNATVFANLSRARSDFQFTELMVEDHMEVLNNLDVRRTPTVFLLGTNRELLARTEGALSQRVITESIDQLNGARHD